MSTERFDIEELRKQIKDGKSRDPLVFLEAVSSGVDPRNTCELYDLLIEIDNRTGGLVEPEDWETIMEVVHRNQYRKVTLNESIMASKTLVEYLHPKLKHIETNKTSGVGLQPHRDPLTKEEAEMLRDIFNEEF